MVNLVNHLKNGDVTRSVSGSPEASKFANAVVFGWSQVWGTMEMHCMDTRMAGQYTRVAIICQFSCTFYMTSANQNWQWTIPHLYKHVFPWKSPCMVDIGGFPIQPCWFCASELGSIIRYVLSHSKMGWLGCAPLENCYNVCNYYYHHQYLYDLHWCTIIIVIASRKNNDSDNDGGDTVMAVTYCHFSITTVPSFVC